MSGENTNIKQCMKKCKECGSPTEKEFCCNGCMNNYACDHEGGPVGIIINDPNKKKIYDTLKRELPETDAAVETVEDKFRASPFKVGESERCAWVTDEVQRLYDYHNEYGFITDDFLMDQIALLYRFACTTEDAT